MIDLDRNIPYEQYYLERVKKARATGDNQLSGLCPFHDDSERSFSVNLKTGQWNCFVGCGSGNVIGFHARCHNLSEKDATDDLCRIYAIEKDGEKKKPPPYKTIPLKTLDRLKTLSKDTIKYLTDVRGWSTAVIDQYSIGYDRRSERITIPIFNERKELVNIRKYLPKPKPGDPKFLPWKAGYGSHLYPIAMIEEARKTRRPLYLVEGEPDCLCGISYGLLCITQTAGAGSWRDEYNPRFKGVDVRICYDKDSAGNSGEERVCQRLPLFAKSVEIISWPDWMPEKGDLTDWFMKFGKSVQELESLPRTPAAPQCNDECYQLTEDAIALKFAEKFAEQLKYCHHLGSWFVWDDTRWKKEETRLAFDYSRRLCREVNQAGKANIAKSATASAVEKFAQADRRFAVTSEIWDRNIWLLGTPGGTVNLQTGTIGPARQSDCITKQTLVTPAKEIFCPLWLRFLSEATRQDTGLQRFLQQIAGLCLTGSIREHALFFIHGGGGNGKSVFLDALINILGNYARVAPIETFTASKIERHPTELAMLQGARLVAASETEVGRAWAESRIKQLTGGERVPARFMHGNFFEYQPEFKLVIIGNHKPILRNVDDATRRRFNIVPFIHKPEKPDKQLEDKLKSEYPAILRWMIEGCLDWQKNGLIKPDVVEKATENYFSEQDTFGQWIEECCEVGPEEWRFEISNMLFKSWSEFAAVNGESSGNMKTFGNELSKRGFERSTKKLNGRAFKVRLGISLIRQQNEQERYPD